VNLFVALAIVLGSTGIAVTAMLIVRRTAPDGSYFADGDRAAGVFGVLATGFAVLLGLVVVLAFTSYDASRSGAEDEATIVGQQYEVAQLMAPPGGRRLAAELVCYARSVVYQEWPRMERGHQPAGLNPWGAELFRTLRGIAPQTASEQAAYGKWLDQRLDRESARSARIHGAAGVIPASLWIILFLTAAVIAAFMLLFADSGERAFVQASLIGTVVLVMSSTLLLIFMLDNPYAKGLGQLQPTAMQRTLRLLDQERSIVADPTPPPCNAAGIARA
jgi:hypothetical protein